MNFKPNSNTNLYSSSGSFPLSSESLEEALLPQRDNEADAIFSPPAAEQPTETHPPVRLGGADLPGSSSHEAPDMEEQGMIMGPGHPVFQGGARSGGGNGLSVPPGARFDPISPVGPGFYSPGGPDFDEMPPPGQATDPLGHTVRPPLKSKSGNPPSFRMPSSFGHPHGAPPGPGNPPFFM